MTARLTRQEIKTDEVQETLLAVFEFLRENVQKILLLIGVLLVAGALFAGYRHISANRELQAQVSLNEALEVFRAPVDVDSPDGLTSDEVRRTRAEAALEAVRAEHGGSKAAEIADVYLGLIAAERGDFETAKSRWSAYVNRNRDELLAGELQLNLFDLRREGGEAAAVATELEGMVDARDSILPQDVVLGELASTLSVLGRVDEADAAYERILEEHPESAYAAEARNRVSSGNPPRSLPTS